MFVDKADDSVLENLSAETSKAKNTKRKKKMEKSKQNTQELWHICKDIHLRCA